MKQGLCASQSPRIPSWTLSGFRVRAALPVSIKRSVGAGVWHYHWGMMGKRTASIPPSQKTLSPLSRSLYMFSLSSAFGKLRQNHKVMSSVLPNLETFFLFTLSQILNHERSLHPVFSCWVSPPELKTNVMIYKELLWWGASCHRFTSRLERWRDKEPNRHVSLSSSSSAYGSIDVASGPRPSCSQTTVTNWQHVSRFTNQTSSPPGPQDVLSRVPQQGFVLERDACCLQNVQMHLI